MIREATGERFERAVATFTGAALVVALLIALTGTGVVLARGRGPVPAAAPSATAEAAPAEPSSHTLTAPPGHPLRVRIPAIGVIASLVPLGINPDGTLEVPSYDEAGWYAGGTRPGDAGPAVIVAHRDSTVGPAVFYALENLRPGDVVHVDYRDGTVSFVVRESRSFAKSRFPTVQVYGSTDGPELRLVTCDGSFDRNARSYRSNLVVWADG
ncbi:MAG: class F sortase [Actinomycetota bacterium]|nr:class F sortase [Actinomycetota bacterium]